MPQIIIIVLMTINASIALAKHGQQKGKYSFWWALADVAILSSLLHLGGFWQ